jgi:hypothetical protein
MSKQTAVDWLIEMLYIPVCKGFIEGRTQIPFHIIEKAKEMEKQQIVDACNAGLSGIPRSSEKYYQETYGGKDE